MTATQIQPPNSRRQLTEQHVEIVILRMAKPRNEMLLQRRVLAAKKCRHKVLFDAHGEQPNRLLKKAAAG
jgi:hypothetical protein